MAQNVGHLQPLYSCIPTGIHGPTCIFRASLTSLSPKDYEGFKHAGEVAPVLADVAQKLESLRQVPPAGGKYLVIWSLMQPSIQTPI